ncbi:hypothetical protein [Streptomyces sp. H-KF8]|uniref:hypothetical protein n=1 Tax=Streptomyces sp. H-KF8 TaxID=1727216 RepID=UPI001F244D44
MCQREVYDSDQGEFAQIRATATATRSRPALPASVAMKVRTGVESWAPSSLLRDWVWESSDFFLRHIIRGSPPRCGPWPWRTGGEGGG